MSLYGYRGHVIEPIGDQFLVHVGGMYGYHYFKTVQDAQDRIDEWKAWELVTVEDLT
jgi:hypothetical protein